MGINRMELQHAVSTSNLLGYGVMVQHMQDKCPAAGLAGHGPLVSSNLYTRMGFATHLGGCTRSSC